MNETARCSKTRDDLYVRCCVLISAERASISTTMDHHMKGPFMTETTSAEASGVGVRGSQAEHR